MPLTSKGETIKNALEKEYGSEKKAEQVLYAGKNKGTFTGIDEQPSSNILGGPKNFGMPSDDDEGTSEGARKAAQTRAAGGKPSTQGFQRPGKPIQTTYHQSGGYRHPEKSDFKINISPSAEKHFGGPKGAAFVRSGHRYESADPPPSRISNLADARDQPAYKQAGPENLTLESIQKKNREYWAPDWAKRGDR